MFKPGSPLGNFYWNLNRKILEPVVWMRGLGVYLEDGQVNLYYVRLGGEDTRFSRAVSSDGFNFELTKDNIAIKTPFGVEHLGHCVHFRLRHEEDGQYLYYGRRHLFHLDYVRAKRLDTSSFQLDPQYQSNHAIGGFIYLPGKRLHLFGRHHLELSVAKDGQYFGTPIAVASPRQGMFDDMPLEPVLLQQTDKGVMVVYRSGYPEGRERPARLGVIYLDPTDPHKVLWRSREPVWETPAEWLGEEYHHIGTISMNGHIISYWGVEGEGIFAIGHSRHKFLDGVGEQHLGISLQREADNPVMGPNPVNHWEAMCTFNPAAVYLDNKVHLMYRAQGHDYISVVGYATSTDGVHLDERHDEPCYLPTADFEYRGKHKPKKVNDFYVSGGGYGGVEDPRTTVIGDRLYMTYVAFDGYSPPRIALTSIKVSDFLDHRWLWERPVLISPPGVVDKSAVIFPEKVKGKYVIMHRIYPDILIDFVDSLEFDGTTFLKGQASIKPRPTMWDSRKIGAGAPPIKTKYGWLLIYQSVGNQDSSRYKIGAMLLDLDDPTRVLFRSNSPILSPDFFYENEGFKAGVVYPCGAVVIDNKLYVYYGGADSYVCVATADLDYFCQSLMHNEVAKLTQTKSVKAIAS